PVGVGAGLTSVISLPVRSPFTRLTRLSWEPARDSKRAPCPATYLSVGTVLGPVGEAALTVVVPVVVLAVAVAAGAGSLIAIAMTNASSPADMITGFMAFSFGYVPSAFSVCSTISVAVALS